MPKPQHIHEIYIKTTPERLWAALTDPELTRMYFDDCAISSSLEVGAPYEYASPEGARVWGEIAEAEPPRRLVMTFNLVDDADAATEAPSRVTWEIEPAEGGAGACRLTLTHSDFGGLSKTWALTAAMWSPIVSGLKTLLETGAPLGVVRGERRDVEAVDVDAEWHRSLGVDTNLEVWGLLGRTDRTPDDDEAMVRAAYASAHHWARAARRTAANESRGEWMISHVHAVLGRAEMAQHHAERSMAVVEAAGLEDFDLGYAHEALARAAACAGRRADAHRHLAAARAVPIADDEDRKIFEADLDASPWFGLGDPPETTG
jgi:uncharacterized protein YndB with AHSA1/START domain